MKGLAHNPTGLRCRAPRATPALALTPVAAAGAVRSIAERSGREHRHDVGPHCQDIPLRQALRPADLSPSPQRTPRRRGRPLPALQVPGLRFGPTHGRQATTPVVPSSRCQRARSIHRDAGDVTGWPGRRGRCGWSARAGIDLPTKPPHGEGARCFVASHSGAATGPRSTALTAVSTVSEAARGVSILPSA
jgi:hypothetical protein